MSVYAQVAYIGNVINAQALSGLSPAIQLQALTDASIEADGYLSAQYDLPLTSWGSDLTMHVANIAVYRLMCARGYYPEGNDQIFRERYDDAIAWLSKVARGQVTPPAIVDATPNRREGGPVLTSGQGGTSVGSSGAIYPGRSSNYAYTPGSTGRRGW